MSLTEGNGEEDAGEPVADMAEDSEPSSSIVGAVKGVLVMIIEYRLSSHVLDGLIFGAHERQSHQKSEDLSQALCVHIPTRFSAPWRGAGGLSLLR